jgi:hypothetical protein
MLKRLLEMRGYCAFIPSADALAAEMVDLVESKKADIVCISAMPPAAVAHARYLCKRLHERCGEISLIVGLWTFKADMTKAAERIACSSTARMVTTLREAQQKTDELAQPLIVRAMLTPAHDIEVTQPASPEAQHLAAV